VKERLAADMQAASENLEFERAARYRDRLAALSAIQSTQGVNTQTVEEADVFAIDEQAGAFCIEVFFFRNWQNWGNRAYFPKADRSVPIEEVLAAFIVQFYADKPAPRLVLLSHGIEDPDLVADALSSRVEHRVEVAIPKRGERRQVVEGALRNAREALGRRLADTASQQKLLASIGQALGLERAPRRIEVYDNSHIMGTNAVGAMIVAGANGFMKQHYRLFNMGADELKPGDDFGMMREMLKRRFARLSKEHPRAPLPAGRGEGDAGGTAGGASEPETSGGEGVSQDGANRPTPPHLRAAALAPAPGGGGVSPLPAQRGEEIVDPDTFPAWPDLVLVDGGKGQLEAARQALDEVGITGVPLIGIAKGRDRDAGRETFFTLDRPPFKLPPRDPALYFIQRLRDEAHRFAIGAHRAKRKKEMTKNPLDEIPGIGPTRKRALLHHFGTVKAISRAALEDLMRTPGVNAATAKAVYDHFHEG
jgi:excinuclease ABC subunit C